MEVVDNPIPVETPEQKNARERAEDIKKFWVGFTKWRGENKESESFFRGELKYRMMVDGVDLVDKEIEMGGEALMLFKYGVKLMRDLEPKLLETIVEPKIIVVNLGSNFRFNYEKMVFEVNYQWLKVINEDSTDITDKWEKTPTRTVSSSLNDSAIVDIVVGAAEESAHGVLVVKKRRRKIGCYDRTIS